ncbi:MAG: hypothetical protein U9P10_08340 [Thermodesulfobacteriota bacterium]|nr:hypothetical protein [Thermodesulfobacteriota bacterium]
MYDFLDDHGAGKPHWHISLFLNSFIHCIEDGYFFYWEAVVREEHGLPLSRKQQDALNNLLSFSDEYDEPIFYIDGLARPNEPWYEILRKVIPELILDPFETYEFNDEIYHEGWIRLVECLEEDGEDLPLPEGVNDPFNVIPSEIRHRLWLQYCFDGLSGLGQQEELTLANENQKHWRIELFIQRLREFKDSVKYLDLTLDEMFKLVKLLPRDQDILIESFKEELNIKSESQKIHEVL